MAKKGSAVTPFAANVMAILIVGIFIPLAMAWGMNSGLEDSLNSSGPDPLVHNANNAYGIIESGNCSMSVPNAYQSLGYVIPSGSITGGANISSDDAVGDYWMYRINQGLSATTCNNGPYELSIPSEELFQVRDNISGFYFKMMSNTHGSSWVASNASIPTICDGDYFFDAKLIIENEAIIEEYAVRSNDCTRFDANSSNLSIYFRSIEWLPVITPIDANAIMTKFEEQGCGVSCNVTVEIDRIRHSKNQSIDAFAGSFYVQSAIFEVDGGDAYANMVISSWVLAAFTGLSAIASTPLWDPFKNHISKLGSYDL